MRMDRKGMALLFDALAFLTVITVVATAMMQLVKIDTRDDDTSLMVEEMHQAVLASTFVRGGNATSMSLMDAIRSSLSTGDRELMDSAMGSADQIMKGYLDPTFRYWWSIEYGTSTYSIGDPNVESSRSSIYVSTVKVEVSGRHLKITLMVAD